MKTYFVFALIFFVSFGFSFESVSASYRFSDFKARPPIHVYGMAQGVPSGLYPEAVKAAYHLPATGGSGTIALIGAYDDTTIEHDLNIFSKQFGLPQCTTANGCFEKHTMSAGRKISVNKDGGWALETSLDVEWAHAIAPNATILLVSAKTPSGQNLLDAVDYARKRSDVVAISMSWGGAEFVGETKLDLHFTDFTKNQGITFFASSGDNGSGPSWPAASPNVVAVGGTRVQFSRDGKFQSETAWSGSGGGVSAFEPQPDFQKQYTIPKAGDMRAIPDVSYNADPQSGVSVYYSGAYPGNQSTQSNTKPISQNPLKGWYVLGGTSAGAPQWAAIKALGLSANNLKFYTDKAGSDTSSFFRDIKSGTNGDCGYVCTARKSYDYVTGLGSPLTIKF